jgi:hypothetical protein
MSILIDKNTKVLVQGLTGKTGTFHTEQALAYYGTQDGGRDPPEEGRRNLGRPKAARNCRSLPPWPKPKRRPAPMRR